MDRKIKLALAISALAFGTVACAPNPYWQYPGSQRPSRPAPGGVAHTHCGKTHTHALPAQGLAHHHGDGCMAGSQGRQSNSYPPPPTTYPYNPPANPYTGTTYIDYSGYSTPKSNYPNYNYNYPPASPSYPPPTSGVSYNPPATGTTYNPYTGGDTYVVQKGDTVFQVMRNTGVYWKDIIRLNNLQGPDYNINVGQSLRLK